MGKGTMMRSFSISLGVSAVLLILMAPIMAQKMKDNPNCQNWNSVVGEWKWEVKSKESPSGDWKSGAGGTWKAGWLYEGNFFQWQAQNDDGTSFLHIFAYDLLIKTHTSAGVTSEGWRWMVTSGDWNGNTFTANWVDFTPEGNRLNGRCAWDYSADFSSATIGCEQFTEGQWWDFRKFKGVKVK